MNDMPMTDMLNVTSRLMDWQRAQGLIQQQQQHNWLLKVITRADAEQAIQDAFQFADDLRQLADVIEKSAERTGGLLED